MALKLYDASLFSFKSSISIFQKGPTAHEIPFWED